MARTMTHPQAGSTALPWVLLLASIAIVLWILLGQDEPASQPLDATGPPATPAEMTYEPRSADAVPIPHPPASGDGEKGDPFEPRVPKVRMSALLKRMREDPTRYRPLIEAARSYFDLGEEQWKGRAALLRELTRLAEEGERVLATPDALRYLAAQGRSFEPPLTDRKWQRGNGITDAMRVGRSFYQLRSDNLDLSFSEPRHLTKRGALERAYPRPAPAPLLLTMHDPADADAQVPGKVLMDRRYGDRNLWQSLHRDWYVLIPHARDGTFLTAGGQPAATRFQNPLSVFWKHHHVDFDRVVLDGTREAFTIATSMPVFFAGIVLRGSWTLDARMAAQVRNFAPIPVYVVDNEPLAEALRKAGHGQVTSGTADETLVQWMTDRRRTTPTRFSWRAERTDQVLPYWVNLDTADWQAPGRCLEVAVGQEPDDANTIRIKASGIDVLSLYLSDDIVDLDKPVRVYVNGHLEHDATLGIHDKRLEPLGRDFDFLFNRQPLRIRSSMYFGWLTPARIVEIGAPSRWRRSELDAAPGELSPADKIRAERLWQKAEDLRKNGLDEKAEQVLERIRNLPKQRTDPSAGERPVPDAPAQQPSGRTHLACPSLPPPGTPMEAAPPTPAQPPVVTGPVERLEPPAGPPPHDPGEVALEPTAAPPPLFDWRWLLASILAVVAIRMVLRRR